MIIKNSPEWIMEAVKALKDTAIETYKDIKKELIPMFNDFKERITASLGDRVQVMEVPQLDTQTLVAAAKKYIVPNSNEVAVLKKVISENEVYVYLSYAKDGELLPEHKNNYVIIKAQSLTDDVLGLFEESELIVLK